MSSVFTCIIEGELPGRSVWRDDHVVAFLSIAPLSPGHVLVVPVEEVDHWFDLSDELWVRVSEVALHVGRAVSDAYSPPRVAQIIADFEVPHVHVFPAADLDAIGFANADPSPLAEDLDEAAERIRSALRARGHAASVAG